MAAFRYWRINITRSRDGGILISGAKNSRFTEVGYLAASGISAPRMTGQDTPAPLVATASDSDSVSYAPWTAFDGGLDYYSRWISSGSTAANKWIQIDFGTSLGCVAVNLTLDEIAVNYHPVDFEVWGSATGAFAGEHTVVHAVVGAETGWAVGAARLFQWEPFVPPTSATSYGPLTTSAVARREAYGMPTAATVIQALSAATPKAQGTGRLGGTLKVMATPSARTVRLYDRRTGELLRTTRSAPDGTYAFERLQLERPYLVVGMDDTSQPSMKNAAVADMVEAGL